MIGSRQSASAPASAAAAPHAGSPSGKRRQVRRDRRRRSGDVPLAPRARPLVGLAAIAYRRRATALHAARPAVGAAYCAALGVLALAASNPIVLALVLATVVAVGGRVGALPAQRRALLLAIPLALILIVVNALTNRHGLTVLLRLGELPPFGQLDVTAEALTSAAILALRLVTVILCGVLVATTVDPDGLLMAARRWWPSGALTSALALRIVPVLARDGQRMADARRCRPPGVPGAHGAPGSRLLVLRAVTGSVLERASDLGATLELRGHGLPRRRVRRTRAPWSRPDRAILAAALGLLAIAAVGLATGAGTIVTDPLVEVPTGPLALALAAAVPLVALLPLALRRGIGR